MNSTASLVLNVIIAITDYYLLMMIVVGLIGNSLSVAVFMGKKLRCLPASHYLTALAIADIVSLLSLIIEHKVVKSFGTEFEAHFFCKSSQYIFYIANFLSVWYVVCYTTERLIVVCFPLKKLKLCTVTRARITVLTVFFLSTLSSGPIIFLIGAVPRSANELYICFPTVIGTFLTVYNAFDTLITALIPMLLIISFNVIIGYKVQKSSHGCWSRHNAFLPRADDNVKKIETPLCPSDFCALQRHKQRNSHKEAKLTQMLLIISAVFVVLNVPDHVGRAIELANTLSGKVDENESDSTEIARGIARLMYYTSFSVNFFLYNLVGNSFRKNLKELLNKIIAKLACKDFEMNGNSSAADTYVSNLNSFRNRFNPTRRRNSSLTQLSKNHSIIKEMTPLSSSTVGVSDVYL